MKGMPLKIKHAEAYPGDQPAGGPIASRNDASIDSEISVLSRFGRQISGAVTNPYFQSYRSIAEIADSALLLVCRLDGPTAAIVRKMIVDAIETEKNGLWGRAYVDSAMNTAPGLAMGDDWLREIVQQLRKSGVPVVYDETAPIWHEGFPMSEAALYYGWYAHGVAGPVYAAGLPVSAGRGGGPHSLVQRKYAARSERELGRTVTEQRGRGVARKCV
jgi:uncharacterized protein (TIGR03790 family)